MYFCISLTTKTIIFDACTKLDANLTTMLRFGRDEPHQEHRLGTVSNTITRGLKPVLWDPNPRPRSWYGSYTSFWK